MSVSKKINQLEELKKEYLDVLSKYSQEQLNLQFEEGEWSLSQVVHHIIGSETGTGKYIHQKLKEIDTQDSTGLKNKMNSIALATALKSSKKFKVPKVLGEPENGFTYEELKTSWDENRARLIETVNRIPEKEHKKVIFKHPVAGPFNISQTLDFLINHLVHHKHQLKKIDKQLNKN